MEQDQIQTQMEHRISGGAVSRMGRQIAAGVIYRTARDWYLSPEVARLSTSEIRTLAELVSGKDKLIRELSPQVVAAYMCKP